MKYIIIFQWLNFTSIPTALLFRAFGYRVIFIEPLGIFRNNLWVERFRKIGLELVDYLSYIGFGTDSEVKISDRYATALLDVAFQPQDLSLLCETIPNLDGNIQMSRSLLFNHLISAVAPIARSYALAEYFIDQGYSAYVYHKRTAVTSIITRFRVTSVKNKCPFYLIPGGWVRIFKVFKSLLYTQIIDKNKHQPPLELVKNTNTQKHPVLYFPHHGLEYGKLFVKDNYYSSDPQSPFHKTNIRHLELSHLVPKSEYNNIVASYHRNGVNVEFIDAKHIAVIELIKLFIKISKSIWGRESNIAIAFELVVLVQRVNSVTQSFKHLAGAKIALLGFDYLFPTASAVALKALGIKIVAVQERFISAYYHNHAPILDLYFVHGELIKKKYAKHAFALIDSIVVTGDPRVQRIIDNKKSALIERKKLYSEYKSMCLVLDFHSNSDPFINALSVPTHWKSNHLFYQSIVKLAQENTNCIFILRGKDDLWLSIPEMQESAELVKAQPNVKIDRQYDVFDRSYALAAMVDIVVARHTSLCDQCLAAGIPVLIYEELPNGGTIIEGWHKYDNYPVYCHTKEELLSRFNETIYHDAYMTKDAFSNMRSNYYAVSTDNKISDAKQHIQSSLLTILNNQ